MMLTWQLYPLFFFLIYCGTHFGTRLTQIGSKGTQILSYFNTGYVNRSYPCSQIQLWYPDTYILLPFAWYISQSLTLQIPYKRDRAGVTGEPTDADPPLNAFLIQSIDWSKLLVSEKQYKIRQVFYRGNHDSSFDVSYAFTYNGYVTQVSSQ